MSLIQGKAAHRQRKGHHRATQGTTNNTQTLPEGEVSCYFSSIRGAEAECAGTSGASMRMGHIDMKASASPLDEEVSYVVETI